MAKKKPKKERAPEPPKFGGFKPLAAGLGDLKAKIDKEKQKEAAAPASSSSARPRAARPPKTQPTTRESEREDELAFHRMMSGVTPLQEKSGRVPVADEGRVKAAKIKPADLRAKAKEEAKEALDHLHRLVDDAVRFEVTDDGKRVEGRRQDVPPSIVRELRRGLVPIDGRLDLHGFGAAVAHERLIEFLRTMRLQGERCVLVIHGKGEHSPGGAGVLRGEIAAWLSQGRAREHVAAFATAHDADGGEGAVYVSLRRT
jgi:DNA-nicking Smr family endonuclease